MANYYRLLVSQQGYLCYVFVIVRLTTPYAVDVEVIKLWSSAQTEIICQDLDLSFHQEVATWNGVWSGFPLDSAMHIISFSKGDGACITFDLPCH